MRTVFLGKLAFSDAMPVLKDSIGHLSFTYGTILPYLLGLLNGITVALPTILSHTPTLADLLDLVQRILSQLEHLLASGYASIVPPTLPIKQLEALLAALEGQLASLGPLPAFAANLTSQLTSGGVFAYAYSGDVSAMGTVMTSALAAGFPGGAPGDNCYALVLASADPVTWTTMKIFFGTSEQAQNHVAFLGTLTLAVAIPVLALSASNLTLALSTVIPYILQQIAALTIALPSLLTNIPSLANLLAIADAALASIEQIIALALPTVLPPTLPLQQLLAALAALQGQLFTLLPLVAFGFGTLQLMGAAGLFLYAYQGAASDLGNGIASAVAGGLGTGGQGAAANVASTPGIRQQTNALVLATVTPNTWIAMESIFNVKALLARAGATDFA